jgi:hypothetical protein
MTDELPIVLLHGSATGSYSWAAVRMGVVQGIDYLERNLRRFMRPTRRHIALDMRFGRVFHRLRYDNLASAVKKVLRGMGREETARFMAFRSHWRFAAEFCTPGEGHEKGGIESEAGYFRRNHWVPVPQAADLADLNQQLAAACRQDEQRAISGRSQTIGAAQRVEREHLLPLASEGVDLAQTSFPTHYERAPL